MIAGGSLVIGGLAGCGPTNSFNYQGAWIGHRKLTPIPGTDPHVVEEAATVRVTILPGGHFTMTDSGMGKEGDFRLEDGHGVLRVTSILGRPISREPQDVQDRNVPITLTPSAGALKYFDPKGFDKDGLVLERLTDK